MAKAVENRIAELIVGVIASAGYDLVRVHILGGGKYANLQIMAERQDGVGMTVDDCATISREVEKLLATEADLADRFDLEVSSPGIDRPLVKIADFSRFQNHIAKIELQTPVDGQRRFQGKIIGIEGDKITFESEKGLVSVPFSVVERAKLVLTDELLKAAASGKMSQ